MHSQELLRNCFNKVKFVSDNIDFFLKDEQHISDSMLDCTKILFDFQRRLQNFPRLGPIKGGPFQECHKESQLVKFDLEQVWQIVELSNELAISSGNKKIKKKNKYKVNLTDKQKNHDVQMISGAQQSSESVIPLSPHEHISSEQDENFDVEDLYDDNCTAKNYPKRFDKGQQSVVNDGFFVLDEMNRFLDEEDKKDERKSKSKELNDDSGDSIEYFNDIEENNYSDQANSVEESTSDLKKAESSINPRNVMFADFFVSSNYDNQNGHESSNSCSAVVPENKNGFEGNEELLVDKSKDDSFKVINNQQSQFEVENAKMEKVIKLLEKENLEKKQWQAQGEVSASKRPKNSLLEEHLAFDQNLFRAPTITEETTLTLEDLIKQRIIDEAWDDVTRKVKPAEKPFEYKKALELNQEKSKISLAEVYAKEYIKQTEDKEEEEENPVHEEIKSIMTNLFAKLNALSNFAYTPKQPKSELKIISNRPSLQIEECTPMLTSTDQQLAPEEIYNKNREETKGVTEKTPVDKKRERRDKRAIKKQKVKDRMRKAKHGTLKSKKIALKTVVKANKNTSQTKTDVHAGDVLKSSSKFFDQLQENIHVQMKNKMTKKIKDKTAALHIKL